MHSVLVSLLLFALPLLALDPRRPVTQYGHTVWQVKDGLPSNFVQAIVQTRDGYLWVGTLEGLVRFDGANFTVFDTTNTPALKHNSVVALKEDRRGALWIGTSGGGLARYEAGAFAGSHTTANGLPNNYIRNFYEDPSGRLWITAHDGGLVFYNGGRFTTFLTTANGLPSNSLRMVYTDRHGNFWIGTDEDGLAMWRDGRVKVFGRADGLMNGQIRAISEDRKGRLWVGTRGGGLHLYENGRFRAYTRRNGMPSDDVRNVLEDARGNLWIGLESGGLARFGNGAFSRFSTREGLPHSFVRALAEDSEGNLWIGTRGGLSRLRDQSVETITTADGLVNDNVRTVYEDAQRRMWFGTAAGLSCLANGRLRSVRLSADWSKDMVRAFTQRRDGSLWAGSSNGLFQSKDGARFAQAPGFAHLPVWALMEDSQERLWVGTTEGLFEVDGGTVRSYRRDAGLPSNDIQAIAEDRHGGIWVGTTEGLARYDGSGFQALTSREGLVHNLVSSIYADASNTLWVGTRGGLSRLRDGRFTAFRRSDGLLSDSIHHIVEDDHGYLWLSSSRGVLRVAKAELEAFAAGGVMSLSPIEFDTSDGMKSAECNGFAQPSGWKSRDGRVWFPTVHGAVNFDPRALRVKTAPPRVVVESVSAGTRAYPVHPGGVSVPPGASDIEVQFTAISLGAPERVRFRYKLEGFDKEWVEAGLRRSAFYTNLPAGEFRFRVAAYSHDGSTAGQEASLPIHLNPRFTQTVQFYVLCVAAALCCAVLAYRLHLRTIHRRYEAVLAERARIGREIHDTLMQGVTGISLQLEVAAQRLGGAPAEAKKQIERALTQLDAVIAEARQCVLELRSPKPPDDVVREIRELARRLTADRGMRAEVSVEGSPRRLAQRARTNLMRIAREAITNAALHSRASHLRVTLRFEERAVRFSACDDGLGFDPAAVNGAHFGLTGMRERAREAGGEIAISAAPGRGTEIEVAIPDQGRT